jgi:methionyl-tRNA formyltransferase
MNILFGGSQCHSLEACFTKKGHVFVCTEEALSLAWTKELCSDFGVSYRYKKIIKKDAIDYFAGRLINMHISLLPWNRGAAPNFWPHIEDTPKGVTTHRVDTVIDTRDILLQQEVHIDQDADTLRTSYDKLSRAIEKLFIDNTDAIFANIIPATPQEGTGSFHYIKDKWLRTFRIDELDHDIKINALAKKLQGRVGLLNSSILLPIPFVCAA